jgi:hypothetical protein
MASEPAEMFFRICQVICVIAGLVKPQESQCGKGSYDWVFLFFIKISILIIYKYIA